MRETVGIKCFYGGPGRIRTCNQTVMSGETAMDCVNFPRDAFCLIVPRSRLVHANRCGFGAAFEDLPQMISSRHVRKLYPKLHLARTVGAPPCAP